ncbi:MAG: ferritin-like domain-containing protein [Halothiobacillaceae bacterium]
MYPLAPSSGLALALTRALDDEYRARATYLAVIARHGPLEPFRSIAEAEQRHVDALVRAFWRHGLPVPPDPWFGKVCPPETVEAACAAGVEGEIANIRMYDQLLLAVPEPDVQQTFRHLREASLSRHLPAFSACLDRCAQAAGGARRAPPRAADAFMRGAPGIAVGLLLGAGLVWGLGRRRPQGR